MLSSLYISRTLLENALRLTRTLSPFFNSFSFSLFFKSNSVLNKRCASLIETYVMRSSFVNALRKFFPNYTIDVVYALRDYRLSILSEYEQDVNKMINVGANIVWCRESAEKVPFTYWLAGELISPHSLALNGIRAAVRTFGKDHVQVFDIGGLAKKGVDFFAAVLEQTLYLTDQQVKTIYNTFARIGYNLRANENKVSSRFTERRVAFAEWVSAQGKLTPELQRAIACLCIKNDDNIPSEFLRCKSVQISPLLANNTFDMRIYTEYKDIILYGDEVTRPIQPWT